MTKQKSLKKIFEWIIIYCYNIARGNAPYFPLPGPNHLQIYRQNARFYISFELTLQVNGGLNISMVSIRFQMNKNLILSYGSERVRNVIQRH